MHCKRLTGSKSVRKDALVMLKLQTNFQITPRSNLMKMYVDVRIRTDETKMPPPPKTNILKNILTMMVH